MIGRLSEKNRDRTGLNGHRRRHQVIAVADRRGIESRTSASRAKRSATVGWDADAFDVRGSVGSWTKIGTYTGSETIPQTPRPSGDWWTLSWWRSLGASVGCWPSSRSSSCTFARYRKGKARSS